MTRVAAQPNSLHASLIEALDGADAERALEQAIIQLGRGAGIDLVIAMLKALVRVGVPGMAARLLRSAGGILATQPQLACLAEQLESMPSGEVPPTSIALRSQRNQQILLANANCFGEEQFESILDASVFRSIRGNLHALRNADSDKLDFVFPFIDQIAQAASLTLPQTNVGDAFLMIGVPSTALWRKVIAVRHESGYLPPIDVVEPDAAVRNLWLGLIDELKRSDAERTTVFSGRDAVDQYRRFLSEHSIRVPATHSIINARPRWQPPIFDKEFVDGVLAASARRKRARKQELDSLYRGRDAEYWCNRFNTAGPSEPPLRVVGFTSRFSTVMQYAMRDIGQAFSKLGCEFHTLLQKSPSHAAVDVMGELQRIKPDLVVVINHVRSELKDAIPSNLPYVCWIQDYMQELWDVKAGRSVGEFDLVLGQSPGVMTSVYEYPADRFLPTSNLTSPHVFSADPVDARDLERFRCDLAYAGHGSEPVEELIGVAAEHNLQYRRVLESIVECVQRRLAQRGWLTTQDLVAIALEAEDAANHTPLTPMQRRSVLIPAAQRIIDRILRHQTLQWAVNWAESRGRSVKIFGRGWDKNPQFRKYACGELKHGYEMRCMYQGASINLQVNAYGSLHQRLLDGLACGAFMLSRFIPADFICQPHRLIQQFIRDENVTNLPDVLARAETRAPLNAAIRKLEQLTGTRIASHSDSLRAQHVQQHLACASLPAGDFSDQGLFAILRDLKAVPHRAAGDIDGFEKTTFRSESQLHELLDRYVNDESSRRLVADPMRRSIITNDTYDQLVHRIIAAWKSRWRAPACASVLSS